MTVSYHVEICNARKFDLIARNQCILKHGLLFLPLCQEDKGRWACGLRSVKYFCGESEVEGKHVGWFIFDCQAFVCLSPTRDPLFFFGKSIGWVALEQNLLDNFNFLLFSFWLWWRRGREGLDGQTRNEISNYFFIQPM